MVFILPVYIILWMSLILILIPYFKPNSSHNPNSKEPAKLIRLPFLGGDARRFVFLGRFGILFSFSRVGARTSFYLYDSELLFLGISDLGDLYEPGITYAALNNRANCQIKNHQIIGQLSKIRRLRGIFAFDYGRVCTPFNERGVLKSLIGVDEFTSFSWEDTEGEDLLLDCTASDYGSYYYEDRYSSEYSEEEEEEEEEEEC
ncbi:hypothetical protein RhiirA5_400329 [Rhizophagus irregularis]|uniref:Uncharacterized protein n=1 Tax=Rhizophagus irregularis TaxID=588596 RepID=A0A2N0PIA6_9GLOM|nr:hypothetical protein RhiirA5_400329 [Rhizophagus irregularis]